MAAKASAHGNDLPDSSESFRILHSKHGKIGHRSKLNNAYRLPVKGLTHELQGGLFLPLIFRLGDLWQKAFSQSVRSMGIEGIDKVPFQRPVGPHEYGHIKSFHKFQDLQGIFVPHLNRGISGSDRDSFHFKYIFHGQGKHNSQAVVDPGVTVYDYFFGHSCFRFLCNCFQHAKSRREPAA